MWADKNDVKIGSEYGKCPVIFTTDVEEPSGQLTCCFLEKRRSGPLQKSCLITYFDKIVH